MAFRFPIRSTRALLAKGTSAPGMTPWGPNPWANQPTGFDLQPTSRPNPHMDDKSTAWDFDPTRVSQLKARAKAQEAKEKMARVSGVSGAMGLSGQAAPTGRDAQGGQVSSTGSASAKSPVAGGDDVAARMSTDKTHGDRAGVTSSTVTGAGSKAQV
eukprot:TRINITY_DN45837_c0_g1_i1.p2 TRINITY_DN45837_c0_g1~~TRINITY_DN45837_c0_g1_i1.p2  ORF type:complete len:157 (+),score=17.85 TRINITY_DN45837_c0_g1_i1:48-518(+)